MYRADIGLKCLKTGLKYFGNYTTFVGISKTIIIESVYCNYSFQLYKIRCKFPD